METYIDKTINLFFSELGGVTFLGFFFGSIIIIAVIMALKTPFDS